MSHSAPCMAQLQRRRNVRQEAHGRCGESVCRAEDASQPVSACSHHHQTGQEQRPPLRRGCTSHTSWLVTTAPCSLTPYSMRNLHMHAVMEEALCPFLLCLLLRFHAQALGCREVEVAAVTEKTVLLVPENRLLDWEEITWRVRLSSGGQYRIGTLAKGNSHVDLNTASPLVRRIAFHPGNLSLQIELVNKLDSGVYFMDVTSASGSLDTICFRVSVFDRVQQPSLTVLSAHPDLGRCNVTLSCQVQDADRVTYSWSRGASSSPAREDQQLPGHQSQLQLEITAGSNDTFYHCKAGNAAS